MKLFMGIVLSVLSLIFILPVVLTFSSSLMTSSEIIFRFSDIPHMWSQPEGLSVIPYLVTINQYYRILINETGYIQMYWNSIMYSTIITAGANLVAIPLAYTFSKVKFKGGDTIFFLFILLMLLPPQVTVLANYILMTKLNLLDTIFAVILPQAFAPVGVFLLRQSMLSIPNELIDATLLESKSVLRMLFSTIIPCAIPGILAMNILVFAESWNMIELPKLFLKNQELHPLSLSLNGLINTDIEIAFAGSALFVLPMIILFMLFEEKIMGGLENFKW